MPPTRRDSGFTLIEMMVVVGLVSLLAAFGVGAWRQWTIAHAQSGAAADMQTILRQAQVRAVTEGYNFCVKFNTSSNTYTVYRYACGDAAMVQVGGPYKLGDPRLQLTDVSFNNPAAPDNAQLTFRPSGSATPGGLTIRRTGSSKTYTLDVEGLTGRVTVS
jgi:prepilin-type N-terminal cleavage/methylation domain-containing protein